MKKIPKVLSTLFVSLVAVLALLLVGVRLVGLHPYVVLSGSMSPYYPVGSLIYVKPTISENVRVGDPLTFYLDSNSLIATHRVVGIDEHNRCFYTKGDANESADGAPVGFDHVIGMPVFCIPLLGYVSSFVSAPPGIYVVIGMVLAYLLLSAVPAVLKKAAKQDGGCKARHGAKGKLQHQRERITVKSKEPL